MIGLEVTDLKRKKYFIEFFFNQTLFMQDKFNKIRLWKVMINKSHSMTMIFGIGASRLKAP